MFGRYNQNGTSSYVEDSLKHHFWKGQRYLGLASLKSVNYFFPIFLIGFLENKVFNLLGESGLSFRFLNLGEFQLKNWEILISQLFSHQVSLSFLLLNI